MKIVVGLDHAYRFSTAHSSAATGWQVKRGRTITTLGGTNLSQPMPTGVHVQVSSIVNIPGEVLTDRVQMETYTRAEFIDESSHFDFDIKEKEEQPTIHGDYSVEGVEDIEAKGAAL